MKKNLFVVFLLLSFNTILACECIFTMLPQSYNKANIVAEITILNVYGNNTKDKTYKAEVKFEKFFKGKTDKSILNVSGNIGMIDGSACNMEFKKGEKYIIFLNQDNEEISSCTPHYLLNSDNSYHSKISAAENLFSFLKLHSNQTDEFLYYFEAKRAGKSKLSKLKNFNPKNNFAVYEVIINRDNKVEKVNTISEFGNQDSEICKIIRQNLKSIQQTEPNKRYLITLMYIPEYVESSHRDHITSDLY